jgi:hypothetical protein
MTQDRSTVCAKRIIGLQILLALSMELLGGMGHVDLVSVHLEKVFVSVQDRCTVCAKHTIGLEIILDTPDGTPRR